MATVSVTVLQREATAIIGRAEAGEVIDVTVSGRLAARIEPVEHRQWLRWPEVAPCFVARPLSTVSDRQPLTADLQGRWSAKPKESP